jgi:biopolymer transport protein ExbB
MMLSNIMTFPVITANTVIDFIHRGGPIMIPVMITALLAVVVVAERVAWWIGLQRRRDPALLESIFAALEERRIDEAKTLAATSLDPVISMIHHGLHHHHSSLQGALQVSAGLELQKAGRFLTAMDTIVTLGPLLGLLGTVTGIMGAFGSIGATELAVEKVTGGIGEALIATAAGLGIAIFTLIPLNFFHARLAKLQFDLEAAATNVEVLTSSQPAVPGAAAGTILS